MKVHIVFDENNPFFQLLKLMGCDLSQEVMNRYGCSGQVADIQLKQAQKIATYGL